MDKKLLLIVLTIILVLLIGLAAGLEYIDRSIENAIPTTEPTETSTETPTEPPTQPPTEAPTEAPTEPPTELPTEIPTEPPTEAPTQPSHIHRYSVLNVIKPTCTAQGYTTYRCQVCGYTYNDTKVDALGHSYTSVVTAPTCTTGGYTTYTCSVCDYSYVGSETQPAHNLTTTTVKATCKTNGLTIERCTACDYAKETVILAGPEHHDYKVEKYTSCTETNREVGTCNLCGHTYEKTTPAPGHNMIYKYTQVPCGSSGYDYYECSVCKTSEHRNIIPKQQDHKLGDNGKCVHCGASLTG